VPVCIRAHVRACADREALPPSGFTPTPGSSAAGCVLNTMSQVTMIRYSI
jgi:hypothetical protein